jgi:hypothetical protein
MASQRVGWSKSFLCYTTSEWHAYCSHALCAMHCVPVRLRVHYRYGCDNAALSILGARNRLRRFHPPSVCAGQVTLGHRSVSRAEAGRLPSRSCAQCRAPSTQSKKSRPRRRDGPSTPSQGRAPAAYGSTQVHPRSPDRAAVGSIFGAALLLAFVVAAAAGGATEEVTTEQTVSVEATR